MTNSILDNVIPMSEASRLLQRSPVTLRAWIRAGRLSGRCFDGRLWLFDRTEIERLLAERQRGSNRSEGTA